MSVGSLVPETSVSANSTIRAIFRYDNKISAPRQFTDFHLIFTDFILFYLFVDFILFSV